ncbi:DUF4396 domain-containing protein [Proteobacteria bacterium 005FR1]|nr:DUF4396 domain-containing protein [Proteobacteria bacterium 005FR1]
MDWGFLSFLAEPWFVLPWYVIGIAGALLVGADIRRHNTALKKAMQWAWPIIVLFFSVIGLALYYGTARAPGIQHKKNPEEKKKLHHEYEKNIFRRVNGAVIHCIAGDGLGIMTAMVIARAYGFSFWQEFWFEYLVGFLFGWFIFQYKSMTMMTDSKAKALWMAFRGEFMSMLTVMAGMGAVMGYVTPLAVTEQPRPLTYAFWGFGMFGLLVGYVFTWPMNYMMVKIGWKHGMGGMKEGHKKQVKEKGGRVALGASMAVLGAVALVIPAWLVEVRDGTPVRADMAEAASPVQPGGPDNLATGLEETLSLAVDYMNEGENSHAAHAIDAAHRAASVAHEASSAPVYGEALHQIESARRELHMGRPERARESLKIAADQDFGTVASAGAPAMQRFGSATLINAHGVKIGEITAVRDDEVEVALGGLRNVWGFVDLSAERVLVLPAESLAAGPPETIGASLVTIAELDVN